ncbi:tetratricopeptide repeat protein [Sphingomonas sp. RT2P30]|uniref:tetratricopeptide repeat protein n=1 Tax=Parasphingomonas halimpatiens TaxID=3096162 RepID=UPI002FC5F0FD
MMRRSTTFLIFLVMTAPGVATAQSAPMSAMPGMADTPATPAFPQSIADWAKGARLFDGLGSFHRPIATAVPDAQRYFDQGMRLLWAFNHDEAARSFARASELDPHCALCFWGLGLALGPNYNMPMMAEPRARVAWDALGKARALAPQASPAEQALIAALGRRYAGPTPLDPTNEAPLLAAYVGAMRDAARRFPADDDIQTMYAEALMNITPWKLWRADGTPAPGTTEIVATLERVLARNPGHPGANHYYIHAVEASKQPGRALASAYRLRAMMPAAGHLVHMPSHILQRVGRYEESAEANRKGAAADIAYYAQVQPIDYYPMYTAHNYQFLAFAAAMEGRRAETIDALRKSRAALSDDMLAGMGGVDWYVGALYTAMIRFGLWDEILHEPAPNPKVIGLNVAYLEAKATALAVKGRLDEASAVADQLDAAIKATPAGQMAGMNSGVAAYRIAALKARARIALARGQAADGIALLRQAVAAEDALDYDEPSDEFFPVRHLIGVALLHTGKPAEAAQVYRDDLARNPENGWALFGLSQALAAQGRKAEASAARRRYTAAWGHADMRLAASAF